LIGLCVSLITFLYPPIPRIQFDPSTAKSQFVESLRWLPYENIHLYMGIDGLILRDIDHISDPYLHFSGLVWYEKFWERVYYSISK
jgi:hypothetical protein